MSTRDDLHRLAEARPAILDHTHLVMDAAQEEHVLAQILHSPGPAARKSRRRAARLPRRPAIIATLAAGVAAAATLVAVNTGHPGAPGPAAGSPGHPGTPGTGTGHPAGSTPVLDADMLAQRTVLAVSAASKDIEYTRVTYAAGTAGNNVATMQLWTYGLLAREYMTTADGSPVEKVSAVVADGIHYRRFIEYDRRAWQEDSIPASEVGMPPLSRIITAVRRMIDGVPGSVGVHDRQAESPVVRDGTLPDGERVVTATSKPWTYGGAHGVTPVGGGALVAQAVPLPELAFPESIPAQSGPPLTVHTTVVIDASTYLPLQVTLTTADGRVIESQSFSWLPPTAANLAPLKAQVPVPAGFTQTSN
jgi:hypothetical protein